MPFHIVNNKFLQSYSSIFNFDSPIANYINLNNLYNAGDQIHKNIKLKVVFSYLNKKNLGTTLNTLLASGMGYIIGGPIGGITNLTTCLIDEAFINNSNDTNFSYKKHYLTNFVFWEAMTIPAINSFQMILPTSIKYPSYIGSTILSALLCKYEEDFLKYHETIENININIKPLKQILDKDNIISLTHLEYVLETYSNNKIEGIKLGYKDLKFILSNSMVKNIFSTMLISTCSTIMHTYIINQLGNNISMQSFSILNEIKDKTNKFDMEEVFLKVINIAKYCIAKIIFDDLIIKFLESKILDYTQNSLKEELAENILMNGEKAEKIITFAKGLSIASNLHYDLNSSLSYVSYNIDSALSKKLTSLLSLQALIKICPEYFVINLLLNNFKTKITNIIYEKTKDLDKESTKIRIDSDKILEEIAANLSLILYTKRIDKMAAKYKNNNSLKLNNENSVLFFSVMHDLVSNVFNKGKTLLDVIFYAFKLLYNNMEINNIVRLEFLVYSANKLNEDGQNRLDKEKQEEIESFISYLFSEKPYKIPVKYNAENKIIFKNFKLLNINGNEICSIPNLIIDTTINKCFVITANAGFGKSTILKILTLNGAVEYPLKYSGDIELFYDDKGNPIDQMLISQDFYLPPGETLTQFITGKTEINSSEKQKIIDLLVEIKIDIFAIKGQFNQGIINFLNDSDAFSPSSISGGQKAKLNIIKAIYHKPSLLYLDETFANLDKDSISIIQKMLTTYLNKTVFLVIDHQAANNCFLNKGKPFYDAVIKMKYDQSTVQNINSPSDFCNDLDNTTSKSQSPLLNEVESFVKYAEGAYNILIQTNSDYENLTRKEFCDKNLLSNMINQSFPNFDLNSSILEKITTSFIGFSHIHIDEIT